MLSCNKSLQVAAAGVRRPGDEIVEFERERTERKLLTGEQTVDEIDERSLGVVSKERERD